ncbi:MAG: pyruvate ferredoxin oxidoreductase [Bacteroidetes bacterium]|nr:pyruvate ferredoxin oxidoreductase [Bacteroidota bacterium]
MNNVKCIVRTSNSTSGPGDAGKTGSWRVERPVFDYSKCTPSKREKASCFLCWLYCPDAVITKEIQPKVDLEYCKGCGICAEECPTGAISMVEDAVIMEKEDQKS